VSESPLEYPKSSSKQRSVLAKQDSNVPTVYMVRHGDTDLNSGHTSPEKFRSHIDVPLSAEGRKEGQELANKLCGYNIDCIYSSDLSRAADTAQMIADKCGIKVVEDERLRPWDLGKLAGTNVKEGIKILDQYVKTPEKPLPGGESFNDFREEFLTALDEILAKTAKENDRCVVVSHTRDLQLTKADAAVPGGFSNHDVDLNVFEDYSNEVGTGDILVLQYKNNEWKIIDQEVG